MTNGFGFSFPNDGDDDDRNRNQNPFGAFGFGNTGGAGGLGDILNQFGQMLSGMGNSMNSEEGAGAVNYDLATRIARQQIGKDTKVETADHKAVEESARLAELWLDEATTLPPAGGKITAWSSHDWLTETLPQWKRMVSPVAKHMSDAQLDAVPEEARSAMGSMSTMMQQMAGMNFGMQLGHALGDLASQALAGSDLALPVAPSGSVAILPANVRAVARELNVPVQEVLVFVAAQEAARQRLFTHVPWLVERLISSVEEYAAGLVIDTSHIEEATRELNLETGDPQAIQEALARFHELDLQPRITSRNTGAVTRLETLLALVEGWSEYVAVEALRERIPSTTKLAEAWRRRRATGGSAENAFSKVVGIEFAAPKVADAIELWRRSTVAVGADRRDKVWEHPDFLPSSEHLDAPADFIDGLLDDSGADGFDEELAKLEEMLRQNDAQGESDNDTPQPDDGRDDNRDDNGSTDGKEL